MNGVAEQFVNSLRLYFRNKMGMFYGYLFPAIFLLAFHVLYRGEQVPLARHLGQLLTVTILGGACLGMPTTLVSERERGVWRRYRLTPASTPVLVASSVLVRFLIVITAGLLQFALAMAMGMPWPKHPFGLSLAFAFVAFAFLGLGLVIAALADNVPSVQALGQCIFLPMLIIGGVAVPLDSLPEWARHVASYFPGRYAVQSLQASVTGIGIQASHFDFAVLALIGFSGLLAGAKMFRWDAGQHFNRHRVGWLATVFATWIAVGLIAEVKGRGEISQPAPAPAPTAAIPAPPATPAPVTPGPDPEPAPATRKAEPVPRSTSWQEVTLNEINANVNWRSLTPDSGFFAPIAAPGVAPPEELQAQLAMLRDRLPDWPSGRALDPVQRVRNLLYIPAVTDVLRTEVLESYVPLIVFDHLKKEIPRDDLVKLLFWVAVHPSSGDETAASRLDQLGLENTTESMDMVRERVSMYALKLLGRILGKVPAR